MKNLERSSSSNKSLIISTSVALITLLPVATYQVGLLKHLPDPPGDIFASEKITGSHMAHPLNIPDGILGIASYGGTLALAVLARNNAPARRLLAVKLAADGVVAGFNVVRQVVVFRKLCSWCTVTAMCTAVMVIAGRKFIVSAK